MACVSREGIHCETFNLSLGKPVERPRLDAENLQQVAIDRVVRDPPLSHHIGIAYDKEMKNDQRTHYRDERYDDTLSNPLEPRKLCCPHKADGCDDIQAHGHKSKSYRCAD
jgi:hypothetical protein